jgi:serine/threonine-protein kinase
VPAVRHEELGATRRRLAAEARRLLQDVKGWEPIERKRPGWELEERAREAETEAARALAEAIELYSQALGYDPQCGAARAALAGLYWTQAREAEEERREPARIQFERLVLEHDVAGRYRRKLTADGALSVRSAPPGADVFAARWLERDRVLVPVEERWIGRTPLQEARLEPGSWLLYLKHAGFRDVRHPVLVRRGEHLETDVRLRHEAELGPGFVYVPAGSFLMGGDPDAFEGVPRQEPWVGDFAIARFPVTFREYLEFINELATHDPAQAERRLPREDSGDGLYAKRVEGRWVVHAELLVEGDGRQFCPPDQADLVPVCAIDWFDAVAYIKWRSARDDASYRLPLEAEWEKAARGTDGRRFPWGDRFDPTFCKMLDSRPGISQPEPIGAFPTDESPYGVRDMAGGMRGWAGDVHGELDAAALLAEPEPAAGAPRDSVGRRSVRGSGWHYNHPMCHAASRFLALPLYRNSLFGVRLARELG